ncbi:glucan endo-1,3-beta-glucosidase 4-like [Sesamum indicum]|uniref:Glucan endo-1,3-beta-glucosidase 4-like n=1 Tax=Sesamum indicum TaxID=4182 RepID=A0A6I9UMQ4_SESIN|nr:glucan endo-1,3-beta-glucosidase 4-like [Sesamum indicum]
MSKLKIWFLLPLLLVMIYSAKSDGWEEWCIADEQTSDSELQVGLDWACGIGGANCSKIQVGQACFWPNTVRAHASYAFNNYFQKFKHRGGSCYFNGAAIITGLDPSHNSCHYEFSP